MQVECISVDIVQDFTYLGANISRDGEITSEGLEEMLEQLEHWNEKLTSQRLSH